MSRHTINVSLIQSEVLMVVIMKTVRDVQPCSLVDTYKCLEGTARLSPSEYHDSGPPMPHPRTRLQKSSTTRVTYKHCQQLFFQKKVQ
jgi:hypothetical protein